ncbi:MAG: hypothetical protein ACE5KM_00280, partial [Planctomycetaceae bacterium]
MKESLSRFTDVVRRSPQASIAVAAAVLVVATAMVSADSWSPYVRSWVFGAVEKKGEDKQEKKKSGPSDSIRISEQAKRNIGLEVGDVKLTSFARTINLPAMVVKLTGRTHLVITAPLSGVITSVVVVGEQYVSSGAALFRIKLSHEDLVRLQTDYLRTLGQLDAERKEITRLKKVAGAGVAEQILLKREYERDTLQTVQRAQEEALRLNGLTGKQVRSIKMNRRLVREVVVRVPWQHEDFSIHYDLEGDRDGEKQRVPKQSHDIMPRNFVVEKL